MKNPSTIKKAIIVIAAALISGGSIKSQIADPEWKFAKTTTPASIEQMLTDSLGNIYMVSVFTSSEFGYQGRFVPGMSSGNDEQNIGLLKLEPTGKIKWMNSIYGSDSGATVLPIKMVRNQRGEMALLFTVENTSQVWMGNYRTSADIDKKNTYIAKITKTGAKAWVYSFKVEGTTTELNATDLTIEENGAVYCTGWFRGLNAYLGGQPAEGTGNDAMLFVGHIDPEGNVAWFTNCNYNTDDDNGHIYSTKIVSSKQDFICIGGYYEGSRRFAFSGDTVVLNNQNNAFIATYHKEGFPMWSRSYAGDSTEYIEGIKISENGDVYALGFFNSNSLWIGSDFFFSEFGGYDMFLTKYSSEGTLLNTLSVVTDYPFVSAIDNNTFMELDPEQNIIICSDFYRDLFFDDGTEVFNTEPGTSDMLVVKLNQESFDPEWIVQGAWAGDNNFEGISIDPLGNVYFTGTAYNSINVSGDVVTGNIDDGSPYLVRARNNGAVDYTFWQSNGPTNHVISKFIGSDVYGNSYIAGSYNGDDASLSEIPLTAANNNGLFVGKFSRVFNIEGIVINDLEEPVDQGYVKLYGYTFYQRSPLNDSVNITGGGEFVFTDVPSGNYILTAVPTDDASGNYVPTYFPDAEYWEFAEQITVRPGSVPGPLVIVMQSKTPFEGLSEFSGGVTELDTSDISKSYIHEKPRARAKATVILVGNRNKSSEYEIVAVTETDISGNFEFTGIEDGFYYLFVDDPGLPTENGYFIEVFGNQYISSLDYLVEEERIVGTNPEYTPIIDYVFVPDNIELFPNPVSDMLNINLSISSQGILDIIDMKGAFLKRVRLSQSQNTIDISDLNPGNYIVRILTKENITFRKISIIR
ncbi:MAG: T9SS type A sorting domain-containing protein [Bacteroidales bacterium]|nr:T9SS type A sorting domain-containing protein [Bacteroidales bacterium]